MNGEEDESGATATAIFIGDDELLISHIGDSSAVWKKCTSLYMFLCTIMTWTILIYIFHLGYLGDWMSSELLDLYLSFLYSYRFYADLEKQKFWPVLTVHMGATKLLLMKLEE